MKKTILIDTRSGGDWSLDLIFAGLVNRFGPENVIDFPPKDKHREWTGAGDWGAERRSLGFTSRNRELRRWTIDEVRRELMDGNIERIFVDEREESFAVYAQTAAKFYHVPVVVVAGHDRFWNDSPRYVKGQYYREDLEAMFIDDWQDEYDPFPYAHLINLSTNYDHLWDVSRRDVLLGDKTIDICFMGYNSHPSRAEFVDHILKRWGHLDNHLVLERRPNTVASFVSHGEYFETIARSKICVNLMGASTCGRALRYYEIPYVGSLMLSQRFPARLLDPYLGEEHCFYFDTTEEFDALVERLLADDGFRERIARAGHEHAMKKHTVDARIDYIYRVLDG